MKRFLWKEIKPKVTFLDTVFLSDPLEESWKQSHNQDFLEDAQCFKISGGHKARRI